MRVQHECSKFDVTEIFSGCEMDGTAWGSCPKALVLVVLVFRVMLLWNLMKFDQFGFGFFTSIFDFECLE